MIKIEKTDVYGWGSAIRGMRNPLNSWDKSDSNLIYAAIRRQYARGGCPGGQCHQPDRRCGAI